MASGWIWILVAIFLAFRIPVNGFVLGDKGLGNYRNDSDSASIGK